MHHDDKHYFVLGRIILPVVDGPEPFCRLAWVSLSEKNFLRASELWHTEGRESELEPTEHPLSIEQLHGITMARVREIAEAALH
ncbi:MAG TPA: DUF2199 domain-containing protein [Steroidobacter sp.]